MIPHPDLDTEVPVSTGAQLPEEPEVQQVHETPAEESHRVAHQFKDRFRLFVAMQLRRIAASVERKVTKG
jgi:hypothetical protein